jgi:tetratricopeptide (TPR) repeat protein
MNEASSTVSAERHQQWLVQLQAALRTQGMEAAGRLALQAVGDGVEHPGVLNLAASAHFNEERFEEALELLRRAELSAPNDPKLLNSIGLCLKSLGRMDEARGVFDRALEIEPNMVSAHFNRGVLLEELKFTNAARADYERAAALDPDQLEAVARVAWLDAQAGDTASARTNAERVLARSPSNDVARMAMSFADLQSGDLEAAAARLSSLSQESGLEEDNRTIVLGLIGDLRDAEGRPAEAFAAYRESNARLEAMYAARFKGPGASTPLDHAGRLISWFEAADRGAWREAPPAAPDPADPRTHVFLVGFPRSGTTLLENVLAAHPDVVSLEERDCLGSAFATYLTSSDGLNRLARIGPAEAERERDSYWSKVRGFGAEPAGRVFIDKMPLASVALPLIAKLFPEARILFARRDPRDVVLSCFRRRFAMNASMYQLLTLEGAAAYYDALMRLSELYRELLPLPQHEVRYESLIEDFEGTARATCDFLGLQWDQSLFDFADTARTRGIATPSASQVARGLNREGEGVWRRYREQMAPVLPILQPWVERFGYAIE